MHTPRSRYPDNRAHDQADGDDPVWACVGVGDGQAHRDHHAADSDEIAQSGAPRGAESLESDYEADS
jgi:hypothetical protein